MNDEVTVEDQAGQQPASHQPEQSAPPKASAGAQLAALREANGWSIELVASQLNLAPRQIHALENDDHGALPGLVIVRGFIRAYAKLLRVDPAPILAAVEAAPVEAASVLPERASLAAATFSDGGVPFGRRGPSVPLLAGSAIVLLALAFFIAQRAGWVPSFSTAPAAVPTVQEQAVNTESPADGADGEPVPPEQTFADSSEETPPAAANQDAAPAPTAASPSAPAAASAAAPAVQDAPSGPAAVQPEAQPSAPAVAIGPNAIVFDVKEDTWVEMRRADDSVFVSRVFKAGTTESFNLPGPISLVIGNAAGVSVSVRGRQLDVSGNASNVARLNVK